MKGSPSKIYMTKVSKCIEFENNFIYYILYTDNWLILPARGTLATSECHMDRQRHNGMDKVIP